MVPIVLASERTRIGSGDQDLAASPNVLFIARAPAGVVHCFILIASRPWRLYRGPHTSHLGANRWAQLQRKKFRTLRTRQIAPYWTKKGPKLYMGLYGNSVFYTGCTSNAIILENTKFITLWFRLSPLKLDSEGESIMRKYDELRTTVHKTALFINVTTTVNSRYSLSLPIARWCGILLTNFRSQEIPTRWELPPHFPSFLRYNSRF